MVRDLAPDAVIVRPPVVYGPRDTDVFQLLKSISKGLVLEIAGGERWFSAIYVKDLVEGLLAAVRAPRAAGRTYFLAHAKPVSWRQLGASAARIMARTPRVVTVPFAVANAVGACAEVWARCTGKPGIVSREKIAEARCMAWTCDTARAAAGTRVRGADLTGRGPGGNPGLVQGGGLADVLTAGCQPGVQNDTRFWAVDKVILAYFAASVVLILGWWSTLPDCPPAACRQPDWRRRDRLPGEAAQPHLLDIPELVRASLRGFLLQGNGPVHTGGAPLPMRTNGSPISISESGARTRPSGWSASIHPLLTEFLQVVYTLFVPAVLCIAWVLWRRGMYQGFPILCFLNRAGLSGFVHRVYPGPGARTAISSETFAALSVAGIMAVSGHAKRARPPGIRSLRLLSERAHGTHHPGVVGQPDGLEALVPGLFGLHSVHHFCYSLSSIPLYG